MANKYPGLSILNEQGTRAEIAAAHGVSERTVYRWINKARAEFKPTKTGFKGAEIAAGFTGTRKELAERLGISERTAYRWLNKAKAQGVEVPSRQAASRYPGINIIGEEGTNAAIGKRYGVSESTIRRWKKKAAAAISKGMPEEVFATEDLPEEIITEEPEEIFEEPKAEYEEEFTNQEQFDEEQTQDEDDYATQRLLRDLLSDSDQFVEDSKFFGYDPQKQLELLQSYVMYQWDMNPKQFYNPAIHDFDFSPEFVSTINMWGDEFETYLTRMEELEKFNTDWMDDM